MTELELAGARGGGFVIAKGVHTHVEISDAEKTEIQVFINRRLAPEAATSRTVAQTLLNKSETPKKVRIKHDIELPIGAGFGTSAGGAISTALALSEGLGLRFTYNQLGRIAHIAEIKCKTGLGTVGPIMLGGCILTVEPGGPGVAVIDRLPITNNYSVVAATIGPTATKQVLSSLEKRRRVNQWGKQTLDLILEEPSIENFLRRSLEFAEKTGFMTEQVRKLVRIAERAGAVGVAQNMVGEAVHAVASEKDTLRIAEAFKGVLPKEQVLESKIDFQGARLI
jgi:pantoate kinase